jgi:hypothetical protein
MKRILKLDTGIGARKAKGKMPMMNPLEDFFLRHGKQLSPTSDRHSLAREAVLANNIKLMGTDEAELLSTEGLKRLLALSDATGCAVWLIGRTNGAHTLI